MTACVLGKIHAMAYSTRQWRIPLRSVALICALCLLFGQAMARLHSLQHLHERPDTAPLSTQHGQVCPDCVSQAPLLVLGGAVLLILLARLPLRDESVGSPATARSCARATLAFRSRAPPR